VNDRTHVLETIHARLANVTVEGKDTISDPAWISALMSMTPHSEVTRRGNRWMESRSERLDGNRPLSMTFTRDG
jgi:hypothetical protein